jgi:Ricin-type beta-trefoil lectin domain
MKNKLSIAALIVVANLGLLIVSSAEAAQFTNGGAPPYGGYQCMDVRGGATAPFTPVQAWDCHGWSNQQWTMQGFTIFGIGSTGGAQTCLDVAGAGTAPGTTVNLYPCNGTVAQQWYFYNGWLYNPHSAKCLDAGTGANGTRLVINFCSASAGQKWQIK